MSKPKIGLRLGPIAPSIELQLKDQGFTLPGITTYEDQADRVSHLHLGGLLTDTEAHRVRELIKKIAASVEEIKP